MDAADAAHLIEDDPEAIDLFWILSHRVVGPLNVPGQGLEVLEEGARLESVYEESINEARREAVTERLLVLAEANKKASELISEAEAVSKRAIAKGREELGELEGALRSKLEGDVDTLAQELAQKIIGGGVPVSH